MRRLQVLALGAIFAIGIPAPALATGKPSTRLVTCGPESCLLVSGWRNHAALPVSINGHAIAVEGARRWRARLPVETVRAWSIPFARTIAVSTSGTAQDVALPIGMLGQAENLAMLVVRVK